ncbi:MAG: ribose-5-phosphate isomerase RpiA [bacterium]|nr:ribose-5-phosphate isomerase RpiA [bacterium]
MAQNLKQLVGERAADYVENDMVVGLGTGSTAFFTIQKLGQRIREEGLRILGVPTSEQSHAQAIQEKIPLTDFSKITRIHLTIDGADEVDPAFNLTKGGGGALLREKIVASASETEIIVIDESKLKDHLGAFPLPVEVVPFGWQRTRLALETLGCQSQRRETNSEPFITDNGNYILDCAFGRISNPPALEGQIRAICGVVECGLFTGLAHRIIIGRADGTVEEQTEPRPLS